jgi:hypothetical protein
VRVGPNLDAMHAYLTGDGGYEFAHNNLEHVATAAPAHHNQTRHSGGGGKEIKAPYASRDMVECRSFYGRRRGRDVVVQLIATRDVPVQSVLRCSYTSCLVNFLTWNKAFSAFPRATFAAHATVPLKRLDAHERR